MSIGDTLRGLVGQRPKLSEEETQLLYRCEVTIKSGLESFARVGGALSVIRAKQLYRDKFDSFEQYAEKTFNLTSRRLNQLIEASETCLKLKAAAPDVAPPSTAAQAAALKQLDGDQAAAALQEARAIAGGEPTAGQVAQAAAKHRKRKVTRAKVAKPTRLKLPGCTLTITPNRKFDGDLLAALRTAIAKLEANQPISAAA